MSKVTNRIHALEEAKKFRELREKQLKQMKNATRKFMHNKNIGEQNLRNKQRLRQPLRGRVNQTKSQINSSMPNVPTKPINPEKIKEQGVEKAFQDVGTIPTLLPTTSSGNKDKDAAAAAGIGNNNFADGNNNFADGNNNFADLMHSETNSRLDDSLINNNIDSANNVSVKKANVLHPTATELHPGFDSHNNIGLRNTNNSSSSSSSSGSSSSDSSSSDSSSSGRSSSDSSSSNSLFNNNSSTNIKIKDDPRFQKYFEMLRTGVPKSNVISEMEKDGVDSFVLDADPESIFNNNTISTFTNNNNNNNNRISDLTNNANYNGTQITELKKPNERNQKKNQKNVNKKCL